MAAKIRFNGQWSMVNSQLGFKWRRIKKTNPICWRDKQGLLKQKLIYEKWYYSLTGLRLSKCFDTVCTV